LAEFHRTESFPSYALITRGGKRKKGATLGIWWPEKKEKGRKGWKRVLTGSRRSLPRPDEREERKRERVREFPAEKRKRGERGQTNPNCGRKPVPGSAVRGVEKERKRRGGGERGCRSLSTP